MDDLKSGYRDVKDGAKKAWREADGEEDLGDKVGTLGDDIRRNVGEAGDKVGEAGDTVENEIDKQRQDEPTGT